MSISTVTTDDLRRMNGKEGLVLQGCGGDPQEWLDGINGLLTDEGILKNGSKFENISVFQNGRTETSSTLLGLPPVHSAITDLRNRQRK